VWVDLLAWVRASPVGGAGGDVPETK